MKTIALTKGKVATVDDEDYDLVACHRWKAEKDDHRWYAVRNVSRGGKWFKIRMHRLILGAHPDQRVDHRDGDGLNNRRGNLRFCTHPQNCMNRHPNLAFKTSRFRGVHLRKDTGRWAASIGAGRKDARGCSRSVHLGIFDDETTAARAYDRAALQHFGDFANTNFPRKDYENGSNV